MTNEEYSLLFHRAQVNLVAFKQVNHCDDELRKMVEMAVLAEREAIAQMFEGAPALVQFAQNDKGGCLICGFTPKIVIEAIRARGTT